MDEERRGLPATALGVNSPGWLKRNPLLVFFVLTFVLTLAVEIPLYVYKIPTLQWFVGWMPGVAAMIAVGLSAGLPGEAAWLGRAFIGRVGGRWYLLALFGILPIWLGALALDRIFGGAGLDLSNLSLDLLGPVFGDFIVHMFLSTEELAWRGFALPRLQARQPALTASLIIGVISAVWYVPVFVLGATTPISVLPPFLIATVALSVVYSWIFNNTRGSVLLCALANAAANAWTDVLPSPTADQLLSQWIYAGLLVVLAALIVSVFGSERLSLRPISDFPVVVDKPVVPSRYRGPLATRRE